MDMEWVWSYVIGILSSLSARLLERVFHVLLAVGLPLGYRLHIRELRRKLKDMPFVLPHLILDRLFLVFDYPFRIELGR